MTFCRRRFTDKVSLFVSGHSLKTRKFNIPNKFKVVDSYFGDFFSVNQRLNKIVQGLVFLRFSLYLYFIRIRFWYWLMSQWTNCCSKPATEIVGQSTVGFPFEVCVGERCWKDPFLKVFREQVI